MYGQIKRCYIMSGFHLIAASCAVSNGPITTLMKKIKSEPRYLWLRAQLEEEIRSGKYAVGGLMPKEEEFAKQYEVSRHTVREAMRGLVDSGMVERYPRRGTFVKAAEPNQQNQKFVAGVANVHDVLQYTEQTRLSILLRSRETIPLSLSKELDAPDTATKKEWTRFICCRWRADSDTPIGFSNLYVLPEHERIGEAVEREGGSVFALLETEFQVRVHRVWQKIEAALMPEAAPFALRDDHGAPALRLLRAYYDKSGEMLTFSDNYFLSDRFQLIAQWEHAPRRD